ncbi:hypothetical protein ACV3K4_08780 [Clostridium perfringens]|uniref:hypothetical protein n=1 Tax=Clostridium perfringens TaxID=1502 RepID=UPI000E4BE330|nr:hypothetical protein [Clostridium perfringens]RHN26795.1 hypothetical protein DWZ20_07695 [Clostridium perfringens]
MKFGVRTPNLKKSFKARTTGRAKRAIKRSINPVHGKKGMGWINNPKKAAYNKVYNKTTVGASIGYFEKSKGVYKNSTMKYIILFFTFPIWLPFYILYLPFKVLKSK